STSLSLSLLASSSLHDALPILLRCLLALIVPQRGFQGCKSHLINSHSTHQRVLGDSRQYLSVPHQDTRLWPAQSLIAGTADGIGSRSQALLRHRLVGQPVLCALNAGAAAEIVHH